MATAGKASGPGKLANQQTTTAAPAAAAPPIAVPSTYYNPYVAGEGAIGPPSYNWSALAKRYGLQPRDVADYRQLGWNPDQFAQAMALGLQPRDLSQFAQAGLNPNAILTRYGGGAPETQALKQMAQIDPQSEELRQQIAASYISPVPQMQKYLQQYAQVDPSTYAGMQELSRQMSSNLALGSYLDPSTAREVEQATRAAQGARGNVYGTPQMVAEAMTRGQAGEQRQAQREQAMQSYLASGVSPAATAYNLLRSGQQGGLSYLGSGQTPYQAGAGYLNAAQQAGAAATQGGPTYQAGALGSPYSYMNPAAGNQMSQQANQWYQNMLYASGMQGAMQQRNPWMGAAAGALGGAASGALAGAAAGGVGAIPGAIIGGVGGAAKGYFG